ncbi:lipopolysaccharide kinase InaA family protein [Patiriisocius marinus]|uniref:Lipopolysaccharide kinase (Kdo/WaaP) family protein n=1 Tax=Patiriisocius marinus TaxID=1397112 RepID=A0A5J4IX33_9FLAO|nr:lipopolysaccharide kinase InaA family protein [Patiriisocius marinus]GER58922.1 hypothetical protein ULMA_10300 [Patiriisocius marinus]
MNLEIIIHPDYVSQHEAIIALLLGFDKNENFVTKGDRNVIKKAGLGQKVVNIKSFKKPNFFQSIVYAYVRKSKAERSFEYAKLLTEKGINTPAPIAYAINKKGGIAESYYISAHLSYDLDFRVLNHTPLYPERDIILRQFAAFTFKLHEAGIEFLDHSPGNTLIKKVSPEQYEFYLIDLNRMKFGEMSLEKRMHNFRRLWLSKKMINVMAPVYAKLAGVSETEIHMLMSKYSKEFQRKVNRKKLRRRK